MLGIILSSSQFRGEHLVTTFFFVNFNVLFFEWNERKKLLEAQAQLVGQMCIKWTKKWAETNGEVIERWTTRVQQTQTKYLHIQLCTAPQHPMHVLLDGTTKKKKKHVRQKRKARITILASRTWCGKQKKKRQNKNIAKECVVEHKLMKKPPQGSSIYISEMPGITVVRTFHIQHTKFNIQCWRVFLRGTT